MRIKPSDQKFLYSLIKSGYQVLLLPKNRFIGIGDQDTDDSVIDGSISCTLDRVLEMDADGQVSEFDLDSSVVEYIDQTKKSRAVAIFSISASVIRELKQGILAMDATHIRFHNRANGVWVSVYDYRCFLYQHRIRKDHPFEVGQICLYKRVDQEFSFTINASFFKQILEQDYTVRIGGNGYAEFSSSEYKKTDFSYIVKDQGIVEPVVTFFNAQFVTDISFVPVPNSIPASPHTTQ